LPDNAANDGLTDVTCTISAPICRCVGPAGVFVRVSAQDDQPDIFFQVGTFLSFSPYRIE